MSTYFVQGSTMDAIADAINAKTGGSSAMTPAQMVTAIETISGGGGTLRTMHYHGTLSYTNTTAYNVVIPVADILSSDMVIVTFRIVKTGTVADGVITWDDELIIPAAMASSGNKLTALGRASINFGAVDLKSADLSTDYSFSLIAGSCRQLYNKNAGIDVNLTTSVQQGVSITLTPQGYNGKLCVPNVATEYEYDVYIMAENGNAAVKGE